MEEGIEHLLKSKKKKGREVILKKFHQDKTAKEYDVKKEKSIALLQKF